MYSPACTATVILLYMCSLWLCECAVENIMEMCLSAKSNAIVQKKRKKTITTAIFSLTSGIQKVYANMHQVKLVCWDLQPMGRETKAHSLQVLFGSLWVFFFSYLFCELQNTVHIILGISLAANKLSIKEHDMSCPVRYVVYMHCTEAGWSSFLDA